MRRIVSVRLQEVQHCRHVPCKRDWWQGHSPSHGEGAVAIAAIIAAGRFWRPRRHRAGSRANQRRHGSRQCSQAGVGAPR